MDYRTLLERVARRDAARVGLGRRRRRGGTELQISTSARRGAKKWLETDARAPAAQPSGALCATTTLVSLW